MKLEEIMNLKGKALAAKATERGIPGRSKMSADELRAVIAEYYTSVASVKPEVTQMTGVRNESGIEMTKEEFDAYAAEDEKRVADAHRMYNSLLKDMKHATTVQRCVNYANALRGALPTKAVKLTPKQMRRVKHKANKHGEYLVVDYATKGYVARTPQGLGIFVKVGA